ncbi:MAG: hypothetical protein KC457_19655 [Myxococcales bacterium]|nr:hypothetical protein [Myxococcales bacterium]
MAFDIIAAQLLMTFIAGAEPVTNEQFNNPDSTPARESAYADALLALEAATVELNTDPERGGASLRAALETLHDYAPELAADDEGKRLRLLAQLSLARALQSRGEPEAAEQIVDEALQDWGATPWPGDRLGPSLDSLVAERRQRLEASGRAYLRLECEPGCYAYVDENLRLEPGRRAELPLGEHRLWLVSEADATPQTSVLLLDQAELTVTLPEAEVPAPRLSNPPRSFAASRIDGPRRRIAPRGLEIGAVVAGVAAVAIGATLWAIDSRCPGGVDPRDIEACPELYDTRVAGITSASLGAAALLTGAVMLSVDEVRVGDERGRQLSLVWRGSF